MVDRRCMVQPPDHSLPALHWLCSRLQINTKAALLMVAAGIEIVVFRDGDNLRERGAEAFARAAGGDVVGVAGDPERLHAMPAGERKEQPTGPLGQMLAAGRGIDLITDVADVLQDVSGVPDAKTDAAGDGDVRIARQVHPEVVARRIPAARVAGMMTLGRNVQKVGQTLPSDLCLLRSIAEHQRMANGSQKIIDVSIVRRDQMQIPINQGAGVEEMERRTGDRRLWF